jgi:hypothetical protein
MRKSRIDIRIMVNDLNAVVTPGNEFDIAERETSGKKKVYDLVFRENGAVWLKGFGGKDMHAVLWSMFLLADRMHPSAFRNSTIKR